MACFSAGMTGASVWVVPLIAMVAELSGRRCRRTLRSASPVLGACKRPWGLIDVAWSGRRFELEQELAASAMGHYLGCATGRRGRRQHPRP